MLHGVSIGSEGKLQLGFTPPPCLCTTVPWFTYVRFEAEIVVWLYSETLKGL